MFEKLAIDGGNPVRKELLPYGHQWIDDEDIKAVINILRSDFITQGQKIDEFESTIADYCNAKYGIAFSSGTAALHAAAYIADIKQGDEVITTPMSFVASSNCILYMNGTVRFADIKIDTHNINPEEIKKKINKKTKGLIPVDYAGQPCDLDEINHIAKDNNIIVIEDASHAIGAEYNGKKIGEFSDLTVFSFHPVKHITTGEGGMVLTNEEKYYNKLKDFRTHGITKDPMKMENNEGGWYYEMQNLGYNYRITDLQCALGLNQFKKIDKFIKRRREIVKKYNEAFKNINEITIPYEKSNVKSAYHLYVIDLNLENLKVNRKKIFDALRAENIGVHVHYIPIHLQPFYRYRFGYKKGDFPISENHYEKCLTLPLFPLMSNKDVKDVIFAIEKVLNFYRK